jgi:hypothetical protein
MFIHVVPGIEGDHRETGFGDGKEDLHASHMVVHQDSHSRTFGQLETEQAVGQTVDPEVIFPESAPLLPKDNGGMIWIHLSRPGDEEPRLHSDTPLRYKTVAHSVHNHHAIFLDDGGLKNLIIAVPLYVGFSMFPSHLDLFTHPGRVKERGFISRVNARRPEIQGERRATGGVAHVQQQAGVSDGRADFCLFYVSKMEVFLGKEILLIEFGSQ